MRELFVTACMDTDTDGKKLEFDYYILIDQMEVKGGFACESYGIRISATGGQGESITIPNITTSISRIDALMDLLTRNFVTPATAADVVADWL